MVRAYLLLLIGFSISASVEAELSSWRKASSGNFIAEQDSVSPGEKLTLGFDVRMKEGWHTYWVNPGDSGSAVRLTLTAKSGGKNFEILTGPIQFPIPERMTSGPIVSFVYDKSVMFFADAVVPDSLRIGEDLRLHLDAEWLVCRDVCIPAFDSFDLTLPVRKANDVRPSAQAEYFVTWRGRLPRPAESVVTETLNGDRARLKFAKPSDFSDFRFADFFPLRGSFLSNAMPTVIQETSKQVTLEAGIREAGERLVDHYGLLILKKGRQSIALQFGDPNYGFETPEKSKAGTVIPSASAIWLLFSAFLGGLILNLMPCVFPILSIKLLSLVKQSEGRSTEVRVQNFAYVAGVILSFLVIGGLLAALRGSGALVGWGFQLQSPTFVLLLCWLFFLLGLQMLGYFEVDWLNPNVGASLARRQGWVGAFFTGVLAVVVASPCTAPFMGAALGYGLSQPVHMLMSIFFIIGLGLATPYLLFGIFPAWVRILPKPGAWMQRLKEFFAFPLFLTSVWLVWLLAQLRGNLSVGLALTGLVGWAFVIWLKNRRLAILTSILILAGGLYVLHDLPEPLPESLHSDAQWASFSAAAITRQASETVFVDFTADWCLTCKLNERLVLTRPDILQFVRDNNIRLVRGDWTKQDPEITKFLNNYRRAGVPFYIAFGPGAPEGRIFPELLTPEVFRREMETVLAKLGETR